MRELDLTFQEDEIGLDTAASIVSGELETNSTFEVGQTGSVADMSLQYSASMNNISVFQTGSMIHVTGRAQENIADEMETALRNQAGRTSLDADIPGADDGEMETPEVENEPPEVGRTESAAGGARATELLPPDAEPVATMTLYDTGQLVIDYDDDTEMYDTVAGIFVGENNGVAQAYTHRFDMVDQSDVDEMMRNIMELIGDGA
jgi:hypothetical protein